MIYFIRAGLSGCIKIGFTTGFVLEPRLKQLQTASPLPLKVLFCMEGGRSLEKKLHRSFANAREQGEWYRPVPELLDYINAIRKEEFEKYGNAENSLSGEILSLWDYWMVATTEENGVRCLSLPEDLKV
jgi:hypothetical protein